mmetsp:Transcript_62144/g.156900  ORF Transcript_62144/g.156900 Transcript_62144/m.156900 type:complete len:227 (-) Transcript_62144:361-1041(-)
MEEPIHICGTGIAKESTLIAANWPIASKRSASLYSKGRRGPFTEGWAMEPETFIKAWELVDPETSLRFLASCSRSPLKSIQCKRNSSAVNRCNVNLLCFLPTLKHGQTIGSPSKAVWRASGGLSNPSKRKPSTEELVSKSTTNCLAAALPRFPCQPATAVFEPTLMSNILKLCMPSRKFLSNMSCLGFGSSFPASVPSHLAVKTPPYSMAHLCSNRYSGPRHPICS